MSERRKNVKTDSRYPYDIVRIQQLSDKELNQLLNTLSRNIHAYADLLGLSWNDVEVIQKQYAAFNWIMVMEEKLQDSERLDTLFQKFRGKLTSLIS